MDGDLGVVGTEGQGGPLIEGVLHRLADGGPGPLAVIEPKHPLVKPHQGGAGLCVASPSSGLQIGVSDLTLDVEEGPDEVEGLFGEDGGFEQGIEEIAAGVGSAGGPQEL